MHAPACGCGSYQWALTYHGFFVCRDCGCWYVEDSDDANPHPYRARKPVRPLMQYLRESEEQLPGPYPLMHWSGP